MTDPIKTPESKPNTFVIEDIYVEMVLKGHKFVKTIDELETIQLNWSEQEGKADGFVLAKALVDGLWAWQRSKNYSAETTEAKEFKKQADAEKERKEKRRIAFDKLIAAKPTLATDETLYEEYLNLQRQYDVIDHPTYLKLMEAHHKLQAAIASAVAAATKGVLENSKQETGKKAA